MLTGRPPPPSTRAPSPPFFPSLSGGSSPSPPVLYLNDLESDDAYDGWPDSIRDILQPTFPGRMRPIRRNLYTVVMVADPGTEAGAGLVQTAGMYLEAQVSMGQMATDDGLMTE